MLTVEKEDTVNYVILYPFLLNVIKHFHMLLYMNFGFADCTNILMIFFTVIYLNIPLMREI